MNKTEKGESQMKFIRSTLSTYVFSLSTIFCAASAAASEPETPKTAFLPIKKILSIEKGFDSNDSVEIAVHGYLPSTCYKLGQGKALVDQVKKQILVNVEGYVLNNTICTQAAIPFVEVIQIGFLKPGNYTVVSALDHSISGKLAIQPNRGDDPDDYFYAPVDTVELTMADSDKSKDIKQVLKLKGTYPYMWTGCMRITEVKTYTTENKVLVVQPISQIFPDEQCTDDAVDKYNRFDLSKQIDTNITDQGLVHVRTLNGRALNKFVDFSKGAWH